MKNIKTVSPESQGMSAKKLQQINDWLQENYIDTRRIPGAQVLVTRNEKPVWHSCLGMADVENKKAVSADTIYRIYSMTKPVTSIAAMQLYEKGMFRLDDPISRYIPAFKNQQVFKSGAHPAFITEAPMREITMHDLLTHQSGLTYGFQMMNNVDAAYRSANLDNHGGAADKNLEEWTESVAQMPLLFSPGTSWNYSVSTDVLGYLMQVLSDMPFEDYLQKNIFDPLGMNDTGFGVSDEQLPRFASCYLHTSFDAPPTLLDPPSKDSSYYGDITRVSGGGGLVSTMGDYNRFATMLAAGGSLDGTSIIGSHTLNYMTQNHLPQNASVADLTAGVFGEEVFQGLGFGLGFGVITDPAKMQLTSSRGEFSWEGMASTLFWVDPIQKLTFIFMTQLIPFNTYPFSRLIKPMLYAAVTDS